MADVHTDESTGREHTTEDELYNERKEQNKSDPEDRDLEGEHTRTLKDMLYV